MLQQIWKTSKGSQVIYNPILEGTMGFELKIDATYLNLNNTFPKIPEQKREKKKSQENSSVTNHPFCASYSYLHALHRLPYTQHSTLTGSDMSLTLLPTFFW